jgi:hypothetical protein
LVIVIGWFALAALFWASFKEDDKVHPIYRSEVPRIPMRQDEPVKETANHCDCNVAGDRPNRALFLKRGKTFCARCEKPVHLCPICGAIRDRGVSSPCRCENGAPQLYGNLAGSPHRRKAVG